MIRGIVAHTPLWVWPLMAALLWLGLSASRERVKAEWVFLVLPLLGVLPIRSLSGLGATVAVWALFGLAYALGAWIGNRVQPRWILGKSGRQVRVAGEWLTLLQVVAIFALNYARGVTMAIAPDVARGAVSLRSSRWLRALRPGCSPAARWRCGARPGRLRRPAGR